MALDTNEVRQGVKNIWQRILIYFAGAVIATLCTVIGVMYYQLTGNATYERSQKEQLQSDLRKCNEDKYSEAVKNAMIAEDRKGMQDSVKNLLNIKK